MFSIGPLGKRVICFGHCRRLVEALDCCVNLLDYWSRFDSEVSHTTKVITFFMARLRNAKQKSKTDKKSLEITGGCVCEGEGADDVANLDLRKSKPRENRQKNKVFF